MLIITNSLRASVLFILLSFQVSLADEVAARNFMMQMGVQALESHHGVNCFNLNRAEAISACRSRMANGAGSAQDKQDPDAVNTAPVKPFPNKVTPVKQPFSIDG